MTAKTAHHKSEHGFIQKGANLCRHPDGDRVATQVCTVWVKLDRSSARAGQTSKAQQILYYKLLQACKCGQTNLNVLCNAAA
jgi:hypothetical protein